MKRLLVMAGGTGGHIYPALAIAKQLQDEGVSIVWLGSKNGLEAKIIPQAGITIEWVDIKGVRGTGLLRWLQLPLKLSAAVLQANAVLKRQQPDAILSMGGFVAGPGGIAGFLRRIPLVVHEANTIAGMTNRFLSKLATKVMSAFAQTQGLSKQVAVVGNPVRDSILKVSKNPESLLETQRQLNVLIVGGSQGAKSLNDMLPQAFSLLDAKLAPVIRHQTGSGRDAEVRGDYEKYQLDADVREYIDDMADSYAWADLIICRAGAMTLAEITAVGLPALLVPYPYSAGDHQVFNAKYLLANQAAQMLLHEQLSAQQLASSLENLLADRQALYQMSVAAKKLAVTDGTEKAAAICREVLYA